MSGISLSENPPKEISSSSQIFSFARQRTQSQVTGKILKANTEEFHQVRDINQALGEVSTILNQYKTKYITIEDEMVMALTFKIQNKFIVIGKKYGGKLIYYVIKDDSFEKSKKLENDEQKKNSNQISEKINKEISEILGNIVDDKEQIKECMKKISIQKSYIEENKFVVAYEGIIVAEYEVFVDNDSCQSVKIRLQTGKGFGSSLKEYYLSEMIKKLEKMNIGNIKEVGNVVEKYCSGRHFFEIFHSEEIRFAIMTKKIRSLVLFWKNGDLCNSFKICPPQIARKGVNNAACSAFISMFKYSTDGTYIVIKFHYKIEKSYEYISIEKSTNHSPNNTQIPKHSVSLETSYKIQESITDLAYLEQNNLLIISTKSGKVILFDHQIKGRKFYIDCHKKHLVKLFLNNNNIYTVGMDKRIGKTLLYSIDKQLRIHLDESATKKNQYLAMSTPNSNASLSILSQDPEENTFSYAEVPPINRKISFKINNEAPIKLSKFILSYDQGLICNDESNFYYIKINFLNEVDISINRKIQNLLYNQIALTTADNIVYLICGGFSNELDIYTIKESKIEPFEDVHCEHYDNISALASFQKIFISGSVDGIVKLWRIKNHSIELMQEIIHPLTHSLQITNIIILEKFKYFITSSYDKSMKIWKLNDLISISQQEKNENSASVQDDNKILLSNSEKRLIYTITKISNIIKFIVPISQEKYLLTCSNFGDIGLWSLQTYTQMLSIRLCTHIDYFFANEQYIFYCQEFKVLTLEYSIFNNQINGHESGVFKPVDLGNREFEVISDRNFSLIGPDMSQLYRVMKYFRQCLMNKSPEFNAEYDKWVVFPYLLSSQHIYAFHNLPNHLALSLENETCLNESIHKQSPLSLSVSKDFENCVISIVKYLKLHVDANPFLINFISDTSLIEMNFTGHDSLLLFYSILFRNVEKTNDLKFASLKAELPLYIKSPEAVINYKETFSNIFPTQQDSGQPIIFMRSLVSISLIMGSKRSLDLLQSIIECKNLKIYSTEFIRAYIEYKLPIVLWFMYFQAILYFAYISFLVTFLLMSEINYGIVAGIFIFTFTLTLIEVVKAQAYGRRYFLNPWNYIDAVRTLIFAFLFISLMLNYIILPQFEILNYIRYLFLAASITSFIRGLSYFRLFEGTRYFTNLLFQVFHDSKAFMTFSIYNIACFAFLFYITNEFSDNIIKHLADTFLIVYGSFSPEDNNFFIWVVYIAAVGFNNWMMLNIMIAVYSDTFEKVHETEDLYNFSTLAEMAFETECFMYWRRKWVMVEDQNSETGFSIRKTGELVKDDRKKVKEFIHVCRPAESGEDVDPMLRRVRELKSRAKQMNLGANKALEAVNELKKENEKLLKGLVSESISQADIFKKKIFLKVLNSMLKIKYPNFEDKLLNRFIFWKVITFNTLTSQTKNQERKCALELFKILVVNSMNKNLEKRKHAKKLIIRNIKQLILA